MTSDHQERSEHSTTDANFKAWLYRPFLDLGPAEATGNHYLAGVTFAYSAMAERRAYPRVHGVLLPSARQAMVREARLPAFDVEDPEATAALCWASTHGFDPDFYDDAAPADARLIRAAQQLFRRAAGIPGDPPG